MQSHLRKMFFFYFSFNFQMHVFLWIQCSSSLGVWFPSTCINKKKCCALLFIPMQFNSINLAKSLFIVLKEEFSNIHAIVGAFVKNASTVFLFRLHYSCTRLAAFHEVQNNGTNFTTRCVNSINHFFFLLLFLQIVTCIKWILKHRLLRKRQNKH